MTGGVADELAGHLLRDDGQEDVCLAIYRASTGAKRQSALLVEVVLPGEGERRVHGNASFTGDYIVRAAVAAERAGGGLVMLHSHPGGTRWQRMSSIDADTEQSFAHLAAAMTQHPLIGMTLAGDGSWSARAWSADGQPQWCESVRVIDAHLRVTWNDELRRPPTVQPTQLRTVAGWGDAVQADVARLRVLVVGAGSVGLEAAIRLAATGFEHIGVMDFDTVEAANLDRLIGATAIDAWLHRAKTELAQRLVTEAATAEHAVVVTHEVSICEPAGLAAALDYDLIISCVDRPWARAVLNQIAYADLIPVIDGGIHIDAFPDGQGMRNAAWRSHVLRPGRPCMACNKQLVLGEVTTDRTGLFDDPTYIAGAGREPARQNVAALSVSVVSGLLAQLVSLVAAPGGRGEPGPLQYVLSTHSLDHLTYETAPHCHFEQNIAVGDRRIVLTGEHAQADEIRSARKRAQRRLNIRLGRLVESPLLVGRAALLRVARKMLMS